MPETKRRASPNEVGGILRRIVGAKEDAETIKREKFKRLRRRFAKEHVFLSLEEAICFGLVDFLGLVCLLWLLKRVEEDLNL